MNNKVKKYPYILVFSITFLFLVKNGFSDQTLFDPGFLVTSDFGPRFVTGGSPFHKAIDMQRATGSTIPLLENGNITLLFRGATTGIIIVTVAGGHTVRYLHMFNDTPLPICSGGFILDMDSNSNLAIVKLSGASTSQADYILSTTSGATVTSDFTTASPSTTCSGFPNAIITFQNSSGVNATTVSTVTRAAHSALGPSGTSGGFPPHMHIDLNNQSENILFHMPDRAGSIDVLNLFDGEYISRQEGYVVGPNKATTSFLRVDVDSRAAKDMNKFNIYVDSVTPLNLVREFSYGGTTMAHDPINANTAPGGGDLSDGTTNGVYPVRIGTNGIAGRDQFIFNGWETAGTSVSPSNLTDGQHQLMFESEDIHGNNFSKAFKFNVDKTAPTPSLSISTSP